MPKIKLEKFLKLLPEEYRKPYEEGWAHNYAVEVEDIKKHYKFSSSITITDTTCRDGEQQVGIVFTPEQKVDIVQMLGEVGVAACEIGYPGVSSILNHKVRRDLSFLGERTDGDLSFQPYRSLRRSHHKEPE